MDRGLGGNRRKHSKQPPDKGIVVISSSKLSDSTIPSTVQKYW